MISLIALKRLGLDEVWWLVSPQNPLKPVAGMAPFAKRLASARAVAGDRRIKVSDIETRFGTHFTRDTLKRLTQRRRQHDFVWLMGADNLVQFPKWEGWQEIFNTVPIAVFDRPSYSFKALAGVAATRFAGSRIPERNASGLSRRKAPSWVFLHSRLESSLGDGNPCPGQWRKVGQINGRSLNEMDLEERIIATHTQSLPTPEQLLELILQSLDDDKAIDIVDIDLAGKSTIADAMVVASGASAGRLARWRNTCASG